MSKSVYLCLLFFAFNTVQAQITDSLQPRSYQVEFRYIQLYIPAGLMTAGIILDSNRKESIKNEVVEERNEHLFAFQNHLDDYAQFAPLAAVYAFELAGMEARTDWKNRTAILLKGQLINLGLVYILKTSLKNIRPDGTAYSFPSGHTANAFAGATILSIEYGRRYKWVPYASYGLATGIGVMRMANNKHYISDVIFAAGLGILSMKAAYWSHQYKWNKAPKAADPMQMIYTAAALTNP
ncbi:phosphatase PAP2 family protein [Chryseobacterium sp.]|uniref:phosphatase PAP2 family protein n=1 Tax=Chryseobacterium sp. TaxID=1871047 RepID=UPI0012AA931E|nr:phosphatase PAP2 family protein [Chryseobacterium sp.]QFG54082.1 phosphatase PAP2 family protein [Chryseobacterium sp.]